MSDPDFDWLKDWLYPRLAWACVFVAALILAWWEITK